MTKTQLIDKIAKETELSKKNVAEVVDALLASVADTLAAGEAVQIAGFGNFTVKARAAHTGRNPKTGEAIEIAASKNVGFAAGKALKDKLNEA